MKILNEKDNNGKMLSILMSNLSMFIIILNIYMYKRSYEAKNIRLLILNLLKTKKNNSDKFIEAI